MSSVIFNFGRKPFTWEDIADQYRYMIHMYDSRSMCWANYTRHQLQKMKVAVHVYANLLPVLPKKFWIEMEKLDEILLLINIITNRF